MGLQEQIQLRNEPTRLGNSQIPKGNDTACSAFKPWEKKMTIYFADNEDHACNRAIPSPKKRQIKQHCL